MSETSSETDPPAAALRAKPMSEFCLCMSAFWADHPHLAPANILYPRHLQLREMAPGAKIRELVAYQPHMGSVRVQVIHMGEHDGEELVFVYLHGQIDGFPVTVWAAPIAGMYEALGADAFDNCGHAWITPEGLERFAEDGTAPETTEHPSDTAARLAGGVMS